jgi:formylglycine-generating enzyme required for sulfatase activity
MTIHTHTTTYDWDARIDRQRYIAAATRASYTPSFTFLRFETFACGGQRHEVAIFRNNLFAEALGLEPDHPRFTRRAPEVTDITCEFVLVPEGAFTMGSPDDEDHRWNDEGPQHRVNVPPFLLARTQCTQAVWDGIKRLTGADLEDNRAWRGERLPMERVSWDDIQAFEEATGLWLPSEAEWEYACRAGTTTRFCFGDDDDDLDDYGWYDDNSSRKTHPVGEKRPNAFGLFDMHGNVYERCEDRWHDNYEGAPTDGSAWTDGDSARRVFCGGSWYNIAQNCRSAIRERNAPDHRNIGTGFRPAARLR